MVYKSNVGYSPGMQIQWKSPIWSKHVASFMQGLDMHSLMSNSQRGPTKPRWHLHWNEPLVFIHFPACSHGFEPVRHMKKKNVKVIKPIVTSLIRNVHKQHISCLFGVCDR